MIMMYEEESMERGKAFRSLAKAKAIERKRLAQGWQYVRIDPRTEVLVPCDENGNPTEEGQIKIAKHKAALSVKNKLKGLEY